MGRYVRVLPRPRYLRRRRGQLQRPHLCHCGLRRVRHGLHGGPPKRVPGGRFWQNIGQAGAYEGENRRICRRFAVKEPKPASIEYARAVAQEQLRKKNFEDFNRLQEACSFEDSANAGRINVQTLRTICRAFKLPLTQSILAQLFSLSQDDNETIAYGEFIQNLNWRDNQTNSWDVQMGPECLYGHGGSPIGLEVGQIDCKAFLAAL